MINRIRAYFKEYVEELLYKVQWPSLEELQSSTVTVLIASILIALVIFAMDTISKIVLTDGLYQLFIN